MDLLRFAKFDTFSKNKAEVQVRTATGAVLSAAATLLTLVLLFSEFRYLFRVKTEHHLAVDTGQADRSVPLFLDIDFPALSCARIHIVLEDSKGSPYPESAIQVQKQALDAHGRVIKGFAIGGGNLSPGCKLKGYLHVKRVAGNFHISADFDGRSGSLQQLLMSGFMPFQNIQEDAKNFNTSHIIRDLAFGPAYPGQNHSLKDTVAYHASAVQHQYHIKVVPTLYEPMYSSTIDSNQYSATDFTQTLDVNEGVLVHPGVWFKFDFSPIMVRLVETRESFLYFLTSVCAVLGGVYAITGILDQILYRTMESRKAK